MRLVWSAATSGVVVYVGGTAVSNDMIPVTFEKGTHFYFELGTAGNHGPTSEVKIEYDNVLVNLN